MISGLPLFCAPQTSLFQITLSLPIDNLKKQATDAASQDLQTQK
jgi:hypothetical protein